MTLDFNIPKIIVVSQGMSLESLFPFLSAEDLNQAVGCTSTETGNSLEHVKQIVIDKMIAIKTEFRTNGVVVIKGAVCHAKVSESVYDIWNYILNLPFTPEIKEKWEEIYEGMKDDFWRDVTPKESKLAKEIYPMTGGFAALTRSPAFHLQTQWDIRQNPYIASIFANLLGTQELMVAIDRISFKYPGQGENEFEHWDSNPWFWPEEEYEGLQGIIALSETSFFAVPGSNTEKFRKEFISKYPYRAEKNEYRIDKKNDPMGLFGKSVQYKLSPGDLVIWSSRCLHQAKKNKTNNIRYAYFITYFPRGQPQPAVLEVYEKKSIDFIEDRINSFETGQNPKFFPSGIEIRLYSRMAYMMHPHVLNKFCDMFTTGCEEKTYASGTKKEGQVVRIPIEWDPVKLGIYEPPRLSKLGEYLLGKIESWN